MIWPLTTGACLRPGTVNVVVAAGLCTVLADAAGGGGLATTVFGAVVFMVDRDRGSNVVGSLES